VEESSRRRFARYVHVKNWNYLFYCSNIAKSENAMLWRMLSRLETYWWCQFQRKQILNQIYSFYMICPFLKQGVWICHFYVRHCCSRLVIGTSRTVGSAKKFVRITSGFGGGEFTKTLRKVCTCQKLKLSFLLLEYYKIRECYAVANAFTIRNMYSWEGQWQGIHDTCANSGRFI
jgi:hypothetical protein